MSMQLHVLLVEDNPGDADLVREALADVPPPGVAVATHVTHVTRISEALERLRAGPVDLVLLDLSLPDATQLEGLRRLRAERPDAAIVVLTSLQDEQLGLRAAQEGAQDYIVKGTADGRVLLRLLRQAVERQQHAARTKALAEERVARAAADDARRQATLLAEASKALAVSWLDPRRAMASLSQLLVGTFAEGVWAASEAEELVCAHVDAAAAGPLAELARSLVAGASPGQGARVHPVPGGGSALSVSITAPQRSFGALVFVRDEAPFGEADLVLAGELAQRVGAAFENARLFAEARAAIAARDQFLSIAAHELKTPLTSLQLQLESIAPPEQEGAVQEKTARRLAGALRQVKRLERLVDTLLSVSRITAGRLELVREELDLAQVAREVFAPLAESARAAGIEFLLQVPPTPLIVPFDRLRIEQVVDNLLTNALKYGRGRPVKVTVAAEDASALISVEDQGIGIAAEDLERIFNRFERAVSPRNYSGLGLGLFVVRQIVEAHAGRIEVVSAPGRGARFVVRLPRGQGTRHGP